MEKANREAFLKASDLRGCSLDQLKEIVREARQILLDLRTEAALMGHAEKPHLLKACRRLIARALTFIKEKEHIHA